MNRIIKLNEISVDSQASGVPNLLIIYVTVLSLIAFILLFIIITVKDWTHWSIVPLMLSAMILLPTLVLYFYGKYDTFDPFAVAHLVLLQVFFITPLIHWCLGFYSFRTLSDPRDQLGITLVICLSSLPFFYGGYTLVRRLKRARIFDFFYEPRYARKMLVGLIVVLILAAIPCQLYVIRTYSTSGSEAIEKLKLALFGKGIVLMLADSLYLMVLFLLFMWVCKRARMRKIEDLALKYFLVFFVIVLIVIITAWFRGSRIVLLLYILWGTIIFHSYIKKISPRLLLFSLVPLFVFLYFYGFYKTVKKESFKLLEDPSRIEKLKKQYPSRRPLAVLLGDLGRFDLWMFIREQTSKGAQELQYGKTYLDGLLVLIPRSIYPEKDYTIPRILTDMEHGKGTHKARTIKASRLAGLIGEGLLNFGVIGAWTAMLFWGVLVGVAKNFWENTPLESLLFFIVPFLIYLVYLSMYGSFLNFVFHIFKYAGPLFLIFLIGTHRKPEYFQADSRI